MQETRPPLVHGGAADAQLGGDRGVAPAFGARQHDPGPLRQALRGRTARRPTAQDLQLVLRQLQRLQFTAHAPSTPLCWGRRGQLPANGTEHDSRVDHVSRNRLTTVGAGPLPHRLRPRAGDLSARPSQRPLARPLPDLPPPHRGPADRGPLHPEPVPVVPGPHPVHHLPRSHRTVGFLPANSATCNSTSAPSSRRPSGSRYASVVHFHPCDRSLSIFGIDPNFPSRITSET